MVADKKVSDRELLDATRQLALLARLGYPLAEGLRTLSGRSRYLGLLGEDVAGGDSLAQAVRRHPRVFSEFYASMVEAAESAERPHHILTTLSGWLERADRLQRRLRAVLFYPLLVIDILGIQLLLYVGWFLPHVLLPLAAAAGSPPPAWIQRGIHGGIFEGVVVLLLLLAHVSASTSGSLQRFSFMPWSRSLRRLASQSLWARALGTLVACGLPLDRALSQAQSVTRGTELELSLEAMGRAVARGGSLAQAASHVPHLDSILWWSIEAGETAEDLAPHLLDAADSLDDEVSRRSDRVLKMVEPWALALTGAVVLLGIGVFWVPFYHLLVSVR